MVKKMIVKLMLAWMLSLPLLAAQIDLDYATFRGDENIAVLEVYINVPREMFEFVENDEGIFESNIFFRVALIENDSIVAIDEWSIKDKKFSKEAELGGQKIPEISMLQIKPGNYKLAVYAFDLNTKEKNSNSVDITIPDYSNPNELNISDIQLGLQMGKTETQNKFSKYFGYDILPNASLVYTEGRMKMYPFCEVYNLVYQPDDQNTYEIRYSIYGANGKLLKILKETMKNKPGNSAVEVCQQGLDLSEFGTGTYFFVVEVSDIQAKKSVVKQKKFYIIRNSVGEFITASPDGGDVAVDNLTEAELDEMWGPMVYLASNLEKNQYKKSDVIGKRTLIANFWKARDPDPATEVNEAEVNFHRRVQTAEQVYQGGFRKGWRSDRGRILIKYGEPDEIERFPSAIDSKPYEVWYYNDFEGGVSFVFIDKTGFGDMELVHSTARYELQNPDWQNMLEQL
ncbi:MAG: GWxTD domain-containing protein [Candidatus Marinimicrobia bacterium]|nr:GWxTD domain-containing protein [Candidatus Neomarinimicrobiota bacterium]